MSGLDDFFKKRDKKKKTTTKTKFSTLDTEELAKNLETATIKVELETDPDFQDDKDNEGRGAGENLDEEWKPFDSEENKDYTGLRINTQTFKAEDEENEIANSVDTGVNAPACPWGAGGKSKKIGSDDEDEDEAKEDSPEGQSKEPSEPKTIAAVLAENTSVSNALPAETGVKVAEPAASSTTGGAYIPPSMRARMQGEAHKPPVEAPKPASSGGAYVPPSMRGSGSYVPPSMRGEMSGYSGAGYEIPTSSVNYRRSNKAQPNLNDCLEFPSLGLGEDKPSNETDERFEFAKKSGRIEPKNEKDSQINLQNKFTMLNQQNQ